MLSVRFMPTFHSISNIHTMFAYNRSTIPVLCGTFLQYCRLEQRSGEYTLCCNAALLKDVPRGVKSPVKMPVLLNLQLLQFLQNKCFTEENSFPMQTVDSLVCTFRPPVVKKKHDSLKNPSC